MGSFDVYSCLGFEIFNTEVVDLNFKNINVLFGKLNSSY